MRTATAGQLTRLRSTDCVYAVRVRISDGSAMREWTNYLSTDWVFDLEIVRALDTPAATLALTLAGGEPGRAASPFVSTSTVNTGGQALTPSRAVTVEVQSLAPGATIVAGDWVTVFDGIVDELAITGRRVTVTARDRFAMLLDAAFDAAAGTRFTAAAWATQLQAMLDNRLGAGAVTLIVPAAPSGTAAEVTISAGTTLAEAMLSVVRQLGWRLVYGWSGNTPQLQLIEPRRTLATADWSLSADDVLSFREAGWSRERVRNSVTVYYLDSGLGTISSVTEEDGTSIATFGRRTMVIREAATSAIRTSSAALVMARAILADLKDAPLTYEVETRALWPVEVGDLLDVGALPNISDSTQRLAVQRHTLRIASGGRGVQVRSQLSLRGRPAAAYDAWYRQGDGQPAAQTQILARARVMTPVGATTYTVRCSASAPGGPRTGTWTCTALTGVTASGGIVEGTATSLQVKAIDGDYSGGVNVDYVDVIVNRAAVASQPGRFEFRVDAPGCTSGTAAVEIEPQRALVPGRIEVVGFTQSGAAITLRFRAYRADGVEVTSAGDLDIRWLNTPTTGTPGSSAASITRDTVNGWFTSTYSRPAGDAIAARVMLYASLSAYAEITVPVATYVTVADTAGDAFSSITLTASVASNNFSLSYVLGAAFAGATVTVYLDSRDGGDGRPNPPGFTPGDYGAVSLPGNPTGRSLIAGGGATAKLYIMRARLEAYIGGRLVGTGISPGALFYLDNSGA